MSESTIEIGTQVELLEDRAGVYKHATGGSVGMVKAKRVDEGFPMVYIEWDKDHGRYSGEPDGWTFESHFRPTTKATLFNALDDPEGFSREIIKRISESHEVDDEEQIEAYLEGLHEVVTALSESEGFIVIAAKHEQHPDDEDQSVLVPYVYGGFLNEATMVLLEAQLVQMGGAAQMEMAQAILDRLRKRGEE